MTIKSFLFLLVFFSFVVRARSQEIFIAIAANDTELIKNLLESDSTQLDITQENNMTPLMYAASEGKSEIVNLLINKGANVNYLRPPGHSSLLFAAMRSHFEAVKLLVENGAKVNSGTGQFSPLYKAIENGTKEIIDYLVQKGADIPVSNFLLHRSAAKGMREIVEYMLENGADINSINGNGGTALHSVSRGNLFEIAGNLIDKGMDINSRNRYGYTPLHLASINGNKECLNLFITCGAKIDLQTNTGKTAFSFAHENANQEVIDILRTAGAEEIILKYMAVPGDIYFGLKKPGLTSEIFAPGIITQDVGEHGAVAISPKMDEMYWQVNAEGIKYIKKVNNKWTFPDTLELFQKYQAKNPAFSADGGKLFFHSPMSLEKDCTYKDDDLWFVRKTENGWSEPENLGPDVNSDSNESKLSVAKNGNVYYVVNHDIYKSVYKDGRYQPREKLGPTINTEHIETTPYIAPEENFIIFASKRPGGIASNNLYISFKEENDLWSLPIIMGEDICRGNAYFPGASPDGKFIFFISIRTGLDIYWVDAKIIKKLAPKKAFPILRGAYLGQKPPGITPEIFAPAIISTDLRKGCSAFSQDGKMFIYNVSINGKSSIFEMKLIDGTWTEPIFSSLNSEAYDGDFTFAPNSKTLFFSSKRPRSKESKICKGSNIWFAKYEDDGWSEPQILDFPINTNQHESYPSLSAKGTLYFFANERNGYGNSDIFYSNHIDGKYGQLINLGSEINTSEQEWDPYIEPNEKYLIFCSTKKSGFGEDDLYVSYKKSDSTWSKPVNMGSEINSSASENRPYVSPDGKYFFFVSTKSGNRDIYWIDAKIIEELKPEYLE